MLKVVEEMLRKGYFKSKTEYEKARKWIIEGVIPAWFIKDMEKYKKESEEQNANSCKNENS